MKILVVEDAIVVSVVVEYLKHFSKTKGVDLDILIALSPTEARARISEVDIAIIDIESKGRQIAESALKMVGIPVIATSSLPEDESFVHESKNLRLITKPFFSLAKFTHAMDDFVEMIKNGQSIKQQAEAVTRKFFRVMSAQAFLLN